MCNEVRVILRQDPGHTSSPGALHQTTTHPVSFIQLRIKRFSHLSDPFSSVILIDAMVTPKTYQVNRYLGTAIVSYSIPNET